MSGFVYSVAGRRGRKPELANPLNSKDLVESPQMWVWPQVPLECSPHPLIGTGRPFPQATALPSPPSPFLFVLRPIFGGTRFELTEVLRA